MKYAGLIVFLLSAAPAIAGTLTFQVTDATDGTVTKNFTTFTDAHITRWIAANQSACNTSINGTCSRTQVLNFIVNSFVAEQIANVKSAETTTATTSAAAGVTPIVITP